MGRSEGVGSMDSKENLKKSYAGRGTWDRETRLGVGPPEKPDVEKVSTAEYEKYCGKYLRGVGLYDNNNPFLDAGHPETAAI